MAGIQLEIVTPERRALSQQVDSVTLPGKSGDIGILPGHTPVISELRAGVLSYTTGGSTERLLVAGGFVEVSSDRISVLAESAERTSEIDVARARQEREQAMRQLGSFAGDEEEQKRLRAELELAEARLQLAAGNP